MSEQAQTEVSPVRAARLRAGLTLEQLAFKAGIAKATLWLAERAPQVTSERTAKAIAKVLRVTASSLMPTAPTSRSAA